jgi:hypothetical protein
MGISCLKRYLNKYDYEIKNYDLNADPQFIEIHDKYFNYLKTIVPIEKHGNIHTNNKDIIMQHTLAFINKATSKKYYELLNELFCKTFYSNIEISYLKVLDGFISEYFLQLETKLKEIIKSYNPNIFGLSVFDSNLGSSLFALKIAKEISPETITFLGGGVFSNNLHPESENFKKVMGKMGHFIDKIVVGEGELLFHKIISEELDSKKKVYSIKDIKNETLNLNEFSIPDFTDFELDKYTQLAHFTSRSCPFHCAFCSETVQWGKYRKKHSSQIVKELIELSNKHEFSLFFLCDSLLDPIITDLSKEFVSQDKDIYWDGYLRISDMAANTQNSLLWRSGGFYRARIGTESGSEKVLKQMNKNIKPEQISNTIKSLASAGIKTTTYWIAGFPDETEEDFQETLDMVRELKDDIYSAECHAYEHYLNGQADTEKWKNRVEPRFSNELENLIMLQSWDLNISPSHEETLSRLNRFLKCCEESGIPNPYNYAELHEADERWSKLHKNAVPPLFELMKERKKNNKNKQFTTQITKEAIRIDNDFNF